MSEELLQLLFFAFIFIALPAIDGLLRGKKRRRGPMTRGPIEEVEEDWEPDRGPADERPRRESGTAIADRERAGGGERSSEGLLPADLWEELAALARGERRPDRFPPTRSQESPSDESREAGGADTGELRPLPPKARAPETSGPRDLPTRASRSRAPWAIPPKPVSRGAQRPGLEKAPLERKPPDRGRVRGQLASTSPQSFPEAEASPIEMGAIGTGEEAHRAGAAEVLGALRRMSNDDLRRAVIFREVLGPPISERRGPLADLSEA